MRVVRTQWSGAMSDELLETDMTTLTTLSWRAAKPGLLTLTAASHVRVRQPVPDVPLLPSVLQTAGSKSVQLMLDDAMPRYVENLLQAYLLWYSRCVASSDWGVVVEYRKQQ